MNKDQAPTIEDLFSDSGPFNEAEVVQALQPLITIQRSTNKIFFKGVRLPADRKILAYGLAKKLLKERGLVDNGLITAQKVHESTGIKKGTVDPTFKSLKEGGFLVGKGKYEIPAHKIQAVIQLLKTGSKE